MVCRYIVPEFGKPALTAVERTQVRKLHHRRSLAYLIANMVIRTLSLMYKITENASAKTVQGFVAEHTAFGATIFLDVSAAYKGILIRHAPVRHSLAEYVRF